AAPLRACSAILAAWRPHRGTHVAHGAVNRFVNGKAYAFPCPKPSAPNGADVQLPYHFINNAIKTVPAVFFPPHYPKYYIPAFKYLFLFFIKSLVRLFQPDQNPRYFMGSV